MSSPILVSGLMPARRPSTAHAHHSIRHAAPTSQRFTRPSSRPGFPARPDGASPATGLSQLRDGLPGGWLDGVPNPHPRGTTSKMPQIGPQMSPGDQMLTDKPLCAGSCRAPGRRRHRSHQIRPGISRARRGFLALQYSSDCDAVVERGANKAAQSLRVWLS